MGGAFCGNQVIDPGEACDGPRLAGADCTRFGFSAPAGLACAADCMNLDSSGCKPTCDGQLLEAGEVCDDSFLAGKDCTTLGFTNPDGLSCKACQLDGSGCKGTCDGKSIEPDEACDGALLGGKTCMDFGAAVPGNLVCTACAFDKTGCPGICGNGVKDPGEACDGAPPAPDQVCTAKCTAGSALVINEVLYDPPGADAGCYIEILGPPNFDLAGYSLAFWTAATPPAQYVGALKLDGQTIGADGYFVVVQDMAASMAVGVGANQLTSSKANMQNGPNSLELLKGSVVVDALGYGTFGLTSTFRGEGTAATLAAQNPKSLSRLPNGADSDDNSLDFMPGTPTPGKANAP